MQSFECLSVQNEFSENSKKQEKLILNKEGYTAKLLTLNICKNFWFFQLDTKQVKTFKNMFKCAGDIIIIIIDTKPIVKLIRIRCYKIEKI